MTAPALNVYQSGVTVLTADGLNTFQQTCDNFAQLRAFVGTYGVVVFARGQTTPNDGYQGVFYWNASLSGQADDNNTIIIPSGVTLGGWQRLMSSGSGTGLVSLSSSTVTVAGTGSINITTGIGLQFLPGQYVTIANGNNYVYGVITSYATATGVLIFTALASGGSGSFSSWNVTGTLPPSAAGLFTTGTSTTSLAIGTGSKTFVVQAGKSFISGFVFAQSSGSPTNYMTGYVTSYSGTSLAITVPTGGTGGSGTYADWNITQSGAIGASGAYLVGAAGGTPDAITTTIVGATAISGQVIAITMTSTGGNTVSTPTIALNGGATATITALGGKAGWSDMIGPVGFVGLFEYTAAATWEMQNPITVFYPLNVTTAYSAGQKDAYMSIRATNATTVTLASASSLNTTWAVQYNAQGGAITFALLNSNDKVNAGTSGASATVATGASGYVTTDGSGNFWVTGTQAVLSTGAASTAGHIPKYNDTSGLVIVDSGRNYPATLVSSGTAYTVTSGQDNYTYTAISTGSATFTLASSSTMTSAWSAFVFPQGANATLALTNATDKINAGTSGASVTLAQGFLSSITTDGVGNFYATGTTSVSNVQVFSGNGTWTKPPVCTMVRMILIGGGGGGAGGRALNSSLVNGGGGGGAYFDETFLASSVQPAMSITVGAMGAAGAVNGNGGNGGNTTAVSGGTTYGTAYGGGGGACGGAGGGGGGGSGGGTQAAGATGAGSTPGAAPLGAQLLGTLGSQDSKGNTSVSGTVYYTALNFGGCGGFGAPVVASGVYANPATSNTLGMDSMNGGGGGGSGGLAGAASGTSGGNASQGGAGGANFAFNSLGGAGGTPASLSGTVPGALTNTWLPGGGGGGGGGNNSGNLAGPGAAGRTPGGGGGAGGSAPTGGTAGTGASGGAGYAVIISW